MKRFTETDKWRDPWFRKLSPRLKCLWSYLCESCCPAGTFNLDWELASFIIGEKVSEKDLSSFDRQIVLLPNSRSLIIQFIPFQYGKLSRDCRAHDPIFKAIEKNQIPYPYVSDRVPDTLKDKEEEKEEDQEKERERRKPFQKPDFPELELQAQKIGLPPTEINKFSNYYESNGWRVGKNPMKCWKSAMQHWKINYDERRNSQTNKPNPRNDHIVKGPSNYTAAFARKSEQGAAGPPPIMAEQVAEDGSLPPETGCTPERGAQFMRELREATEQGVQDDNLG